MKKLSITVKPFLNKSLKPQLADDHVERHGLYFQITYQRKNTQIKSIFNTYLENLSEIENNKSITYEIDLLKRHVRFEIARNQKSISLIGIKTRYEKMATPVDTIFQQYLKNKLSRILVNSQSEFLPILKFEGFDVQFLTLLKASKLLVENLNKLIDPEFKDEIDAYKIFYKFISNKTYSYLHFSVLDWVDGSYKIELNRYFMAQLGESSKEIAKITTILNIIVEERIKYLI